jgi:transposase-like protein
MSQSYEKRWGRYAQPVNSSWRVDETYISVRGRPHYLYRAVDRYGKSVDHLLRADRSREAAQAFFRKAVVTHATAWPCKVNLDGNAASHRAMRLLGEEDPRWQRVVVRARRYLNNIVEQDHRAIKRRCAPMLGFKSFTSAETTLAGIELAHRIHKGQFAFGSFHDGASLKQLWDRALAEVDAPGEDSRGGLSPSTANAPELRGGTGHRVCSVRSPRRGVRYARKLSDGEGLYLLVVPTGGRYWRYNYRFNGKQKTLALGIYPDVPLEAARMRHRAARQLLASGTDPALRRQDLRKAGVGNLDIGGETAIGRQGGRLQEQHLSAGTWASRG